MLSRFTVTICVSMAVVEDSATVFRGISGVLFSAFVFSLRRRGCCNIFHTYSFKWEFGRGSGSLERVLLAIAVC